ncbi:MAG TPA: AMP-binding protein [Gallionellaceae bacterium]|nr:AMP-binding protein [Gallionellaceae bacterium]
MNTPVSDPARAVLDIVRGLAAELHSGRRGSTITLDSSLVRDLGFDSLARVELLLRIGHTFSANLPEQVLASAETPRDLLRAVLAASTVPQPAIVKQIREAIPEQISATPEHAATLLEMLDWHVQAHPGRTHITLCGEAAEEEISYQALYTGAASVASGLQQQDLQPGQTVAIMLPTSREYFYSFYGVLLAGGVPVPIYPPARLAQIEDHLRRHAGILANAQTAILITFAEALPLARLLKSQLAGLRTVTTVSELESFRENLVRPVLKAQDVALLQYTSGSTGNPKGVVLTHANLLANIRAMGQAVEADSTDVFVSWLPLYHDMGLIGAWLGSLYFAMRLVVMSPLTFLLRPERWLWAIHSHGGTLSAGPNFAYELCVRKIEDSALEGLDLHSWRLAFNGAEPVSPDTVLRFGERFARYGLRREAIAPVYGLAECAVGLAFPPPGRGPVIDRIRREGFVRSGRAIPAAQDEHDALRFVACGQSLPGHQIRIVDAAGSEVGEREEGQLEFCGPSATSGYFRNPEQTRRLFHATVQGDKGEWLESGDLAYMAGGDIYITSRIKDVIIRAGRNIYPYELEEAVGDIPGIRKGCVAVFASTDPIAATERLVVLAETRETRGDVLLSLHDQINSRAVALLGEPPDDIVLAPPHTVLKTSSGKIRRAASRELYEQGMLGTQQRAVWWQFVRLSWAGVLPQLRRSGRAATGILYGGYAWGLFLILAPLTWLMVCMLPRPVWAWSASRVMARIFVRLSGTPFVVHGLDKLPHDTPCVLVANHASYLDGILLLAALPRQFCFVAKRELKENLVTRLYLQRIGAEFVERFGFEQSVADVKRLLHILRGGQSLAFFPEGTFYRMPGLLPFRMGAFVMAAQAGVPVVPIVIRGSRSILRSDQWLPRRGAISINISGPITPQGDDWPAAIKLRDAARAEILHLCGEPELPSP